MVCIRGAQKREIILVWDRENDAPIFALEEIALVMFIKLFGDDMAAPNKAHAVCRVHSNGVANDVFDLWPTCIHNHLGNGSLLFTIRVLG